MQNTPKTPVEFCDRLNWLSSKYRALRASIAGASGDPAAMEGVTCLAMDLEDELTGLARAYDGAEWGSRSGRLTGRAIVEAMREMPEPELRLVIEAVATLREALADESN